MEEAVRESAPAAAAMAELLRRVRRDSMGSSLVLGRNHATRAGRDVDSWRQTKCGAGQQARKRSNQKFANPPKIPVFDWQVPARDSHRICPFRDQAARRSPATIAFTFPKPGGSMRLRDLACVLSLAACSFPCLGTRFHISDASKIVRLSDPEISPDGTAVVVAVGRANLDEDRTDSELMLVDVAARSTRVLTRRAHAGFPRWSPDGKALAFLADDDSKHLQIFTLAMEHGGDAAQLTHFPTSIEQIAWRPDGRALAFVAEDKESERKGRDKFNDAIEIGNNDFLAHSRQMPAHLWVVELPSSPNATA